MSTTADVLRAVPLFGGMTDRSIATISQLAEPTSFPAGETLVREGDPGESFIVLTAGEATVEQGGRTLRTLHAGDFLGEISLVDGGLGPRPSPRRRRSRRWSSIGRDSAGSWRSSRPCGSTCSTP
jgi:CRP-like cAMP-binding protein